ncbi:MAG: hypothetical protein HZB55_21900 [Deltaproteobacteria bacterium]|nr:hypothetical protein [Deltaproteobacteria bacterium]
MSGKRFWLLAMVLLAAACTKYEQKPLPFRDPSSYPNSTAAFGATVGAQSFDDPTRAKEIFGFDILGAGVLPVQIAFDNQGPDPIEIAPSQTFLVDTEGNLWNVLDQKLAYDRIAKKTELGEVAPEAAKTGFLGAAAGAIVGAAIGIVTGTSIGEAAGKGAAVGGAGGAVIGGAKGVQEPSVGRKISDDLHNRSLENRPVPPKALSHGVLFFPAEAIKARILRLQLRDMATGETVNLKLAL